MAPEKQGALSLDKTLQRQHRGSTLRYQSKNRMHRSTQNKNIFHEKQVLRQERCQLIAPVAR